MPFGQLYNLSRSEGKVVEKYGQVSLKTGLIHPLSSPLSAGKRTELYKTGRLPLSINSCNASWGSQTFTVGSSGILVWLQRPSRHSKPLKHPALGPRQLTKLSSSLKHSSPRPLFFSTLIRPSNSLWRWMRPIQWRGPFSPKALPPTTRYHHCEKHFSPTKICYNVGNQELLA
ncbi:hypothetical protein CHARACLAT_032803 [Characodon lateralis]|uniref:Uncharacterized protein n=1 Tax=Characodon lateralis TaxID=208331 RepID=A0ABU7EZ03_9TELE|nr:hypothetical protein [Characodon lateralis]